MGSRPRRVGARQGRGRSPGVAELVESPPWSCGVMARQGVDVAATMEMEGSRPWRCSDCVAHAWEIAGRSGSGWLWGWSSGDERGDGGLGKGAGHEDGVEGCCGG